MRFLRSKTEQVCRSSATTQPHSETLPSTHASPLPIHTRAFYFQLWLLGRLIPLFTAICPLFPFLAGRERISSTTSPSSGSRWGGRPVSTTDSFSSNHNAYLHHATKSLTTHHSPLTTQQVLAKLQRLASGPGKLQATSRQAADAASSHSNSPCLALFPHLSGRRLPFALHLVWDKCCIITSVSMCCD